MSSIAGCFGGLRRHGRGAWLQWAGAACCLIASPSWAQSDSPRERADGRVPLLTPTFSASETYIETRASATVPNGGEFITRLSPGIRVAARSGRIQGSLSYALNANYRSKQDPASEIQNALNADFTAEAVPNWLYVDANATISQQSLSAYGVQSPSDNLQANANRAEVGTASISPYVRGTVGRFFDYQVRLNASINEVKGTSDSDSNTTGGSVLIRSVQGNTPLGWDIIASRQNIDYKVGNSTSNDRIYLSLSYRVNTSLRVSANVGQEATDVGTIDRQRYDNWGYGVRWEPSDRTSLRFLSEERYFGRSHVLAFETRSQRSQWFYTDTRGTTNGGDPNGVGRPITLYQQLFSQFAAAQPDPALREQLVLDYLLAIGRDPGEVVNGGLLTAGVSVQRRQDLRYSWTGRRLTFDLAAFASATQLIDNPSGAPDEGETRLRGYTATLSHRLTPATTLQFSGSRQVTDDNLVNPGNELKSVTAGWNTRHGRFIDTRVLARYAVFNSPISPYRETSLTAAINFRFN